MHTGDSQNYFATHTKIYYIIIYYIIS